MDKKKVLETSLVLTTAFLVIYILKPNQVFLYLAVAFGFIGIFIKPLAKLIAIAWFKLADVLNYIMSKIVLGIVFYLVLFPISLLYRLSQKDKLQLKRQKKSTWIERNYEYKAADLKNIW
jgi:hypothetical protein